MPVRRPRPLLSPAVPPDVGQRVRVGRGPGVMVLNPKFTFTCSGFVTIHLLSHIF